MKDCEKELNAIKELLDMHTIGRPGDPLPLRVRTALEDLHAALCRVTMAELTQPGAASPERT